MVTDDIYYTHFNGERPFKVHISKKYNMLAYHHNKLVLTDIAKEIFIGKSVKNRMTIFSGGYGSYFDGNTILYQRKVDGNYIFIGNNIFSFKTHSPIIEYHSPVGNNDVPYPYAKDELGNYYLLIEGTIIMNSESVRNITDPYDYYYRNCSITDKNFDNIEKWSVGNDIYNFNYNSNPVANYDRLTSKGEKMIIYYKDNSNVELTKEMYIDIIFRYGQMMGFYYIQGKMLVD